MVVSGFEMGLICQKKSRVKLMSSAMPYNVTLFTKPQNELKQHAEYDVTSQMYNFIPPLSVINRYVLISDNLFYVM